MTNNKKISFRADEQFAGRIDKLKKEKFYDKSYAELYRYVIEAGLTAISKE